MSHLGFFVVCAGVVAKLIGALQPSYDLFDVANLPGIVYNLGQSPSPNTFGSTVSPAGDFNGDNIADFITSGTSGAGGAGIVYVIFGKSQLSGLTVANFADGPTTGFRIYGIATTDQAGQSIGGGADLNDDGFDDIMVGAVQNALYVIFGHDGSVRSITALNLADWSIGAVGFRITFSSAVTVQNFGNAVRYAGDVNNDGHDDIIIGGSGVTRTPGSTYSGIAYVLLGRSAASVATTPFADKVLTVSTSDADGYLMLGSTAWTYFGATVAAAGDVNNDGFDDVLVGCPDMDSNSLSMNGMAYVIFGYDTSSGTHIIDMASPPSGYGIKISGPLSSVRLPSALSGVGDTNGDGIDDFAVTVARLTGAGDAGAVYVIYGGSLTADINLATFTTGSAGFKFLGILSMDNLGGSIARVGDVNLDGREDFIVGGLGVFGSNYGAGLVVYGRSSSRTANLLTSDIGAPDDMLMYGQYGTVAGYAVGGIGDVNADGAPDMFVSTYWGNSFVVFGDAPPRPAPTPAPTAKPTSAAPTRPPTTAPSYLTSVYESVSYKIRNGFAFAITAADGSGYAWGELPYGGNSTGVHSFLASGVTDIVPSRFSFAATNDAQDSAAFWGVGVSGVATSIHGVVANEAAYAGVTTTGAVAAFGSKHHGGDVTDDARCNGFSLKLSSGVDYIVASAGAFAAVMLNGGIYAWGSTQTGAGVSTDTVAQLNSIRQVVATRESFAARTWSGKVMTWGSIYAGGDSTSVAASLSSDVFHLVATKSGFVAFKPGYQIIVWGFSKYGGDTSAVQSALTADVVSVAYTFTAMAALNADGSVTTWGVAESGGDSSAVQADLHDIVRIYGNSKAFAALTSAGGVVAWGRAAYGGQIPAGKVTSLSSGVVSIQHTDRAFAALKSDGTVVVWGQAGHGGSPGAAVEALLTNVHTVCGNDVAFSAIRTDGSVVSWGHSVSVPAPGVQFTASSLTQAARCAQ
jgi:alpha-tubulin suppressor-like RCC1 family protein